MSSVKKAESEGSVRSITPNTIQVEVIQNSACGSCPSSCCTMSESQTCVYEVECFEAPKKFAVGDRVKVFIPLSQGEKAAVLAYLVPAILTVGTLVIIFGLTKNELISGLGALFILLPYFLILKVFRKTFQKEFKLQVEKI